jgi:hypothetical protein
VPSELVPPSGGDDARVEVSRGRSSDVAPFVKGQTRGAIRSHAFDARGTQTRGLSIFDSHKAPLSSIARRACSSGFCCLLGGFVWAHLNADTRDLLVSGVAVPGVAGYARITTSCPLPASFRMMVSALSVSSAVNPPQNQRTLRAPGPTPSAGPDGMPRILARQLRATSRRRTAWAASCFSTTRPSRSFLCSGDMARAMQP